jgi:1-acyl-sn-glycerol-3-phosphate acyltransferase
MAKWLARAFLWITGWQLEGVKPSARKFVLVAAPHTSNWDLAYMLALSVLCDIKIRWMGKHALFRPPLGWLMHRVGGIPVVRHRAGNLVRQLVRQFESSDEFALVVPAEGTRGRAPHWKSGFYHIARAADVPVLLGYLDYPRKRGGFGPAFELTGDVSADMDEVRSFYADKVGRYPDLFGPVQLKEEI